MDLSNQYVALEQVDGVAYLFGHFFVCWNITSSNAHLTNRQENVIISAKVFVKILVLQIKIVQFIGNIIIALVIAWILQLWVYV